MIKGISGANQFNDYNRLQSELHARSLFTKNLTELSRKGLENGHFNRNEQVTTFAAPGTTAKDFEEMTFMMAGLIDKKRRPLSARAFEGPTVAKRIESIEKLREMYELLDSEYNQKNLQFRAKKAFEQAQQEQTIEFPDNSIPAGNFIILKEALNLAILRDDEKSKKRIEDEIAKLEEKQRPKIDAGLNTAEVLHGAFENSSDRQAMRAVYYQSILGSASVSGLMQSLLNTFGGKNFSKNINTLTKAVMQDIRSARPSAPPELLETKLRDLNRVNYARSMVNDCKQFLANYYKQQNIEEQSSVSLTKELLKLISGTILGKDLDTIANHYAGKDPDQKLIFLNSLFPFMKSFPEILWENQKNRMTGLQTMLVYLENEANKLHKI